MIIGDVAAYYDRFFADHGATPAGVDWADHESQELRFETLLSGFDLKPGTTVLDFGCGYGALAEYLDRLGPDLRYQGFDVVKSMIADATVRHSGQRGRTFTSNRQELVAADLVVASGVFNVRLDAAHADWRLYVEDTLTTLRTLARQRLAFNLIPLASAPDLVRSHLFYVDPVEFGGWCRRMLDGKVSIVDGYGLWEFTVHVDLGEWDES